MKHIGCRLASMLAPALLLAALGCGEDAQSPTAPEPSTPGATPALASASTQALSFRQVSAGWAHSCGVTTDNRAYCWGSNWMGQFGDGTSMNSSTSPVAAGGGLSFLQVSAGNYYSCGVTTDYRAYCWGNNFSGQLGDGTTTNRTMPIPVAGGHRFRLVRTGVNHTCGVTLSDEAFCWGNNRYGQLGDSSEAIRRKRPVRVAGGHSFRRVVPGVLHTCGATTVGLGFCWGYGADGQIGDGKTYQRRWPRAVAGGLSFRQVLAGGYHSCGVTSDSRVYCWGHNGYGQLGDGTTTGRLKPVAVAGGLSFTAVGPGSYHTCGVTTNDRAYCWGWNGSGQLGDGTVTGRLTPVAVAGNLPIDGVSTSLNLYTGHTCGLTTDNRAYCWGDNEDGQLGDGTNDDKLTPVAVIGAM
ncbi:MAG TPA: hypothetical protein VGJ36_03380 [Gemmatimonadales bacterium]